MNGSPARILPCGDAALLVELGGGGETTDLVLGLDAAVTAARLPGVVECVPGLTTLLIELDPLVADAGWLREELLRLAAVSGAHRPEGRRFELPVCFAEGLAWDLATAAAAAGLATQDLIGLLCATELRVALIGHLPGLPYLTGLPEALDLPRRATARPRVPRGSLGLAARMACVYPVDAPGGWHIVGRTPARVLDEAADPPVRLAPGDALQLRAVEAGELAALEAAEAAGLTALRPRV